MNLKIAALCVLCVFMHHSSMGQAHKKFNLPSGISSSDYESGSVWVKLKQIHKDIFEGDKTGGRIPAKINALQVRPLISRQSNTKSMARVAPRKVHVDISLYYQVIFDKSRPVEDFINELYATGYFDVVEPVYTVKPFFTPDDPSLSQQYYLDLIHAPEAWDITQGDQSIIIGIVDTGGDLDHPDLQGNLYIDPAEPLDGIDNDGDGFIDNDRGWDFSGADLALIGTPGFIGDNDPSVSKGNLFAHGTMVAGCASPSTNNGIGISGIGFNTKLLFTKHFADNQGDVGTSYSSNLYDGVLYAATHGAKIINCSWGSYNPSAIAQDIISYVTLDLGCLVIAAAGNSNLETPIYPASYEYVVSVASCDENDVRAPMSNFGKTIDITSPGRFIYTTSYDDAYTTDSGTSLAAPIVSGAAALVWAHNPMFTPLQVAEQLRVSADESIYSVNPSYINKLGKGRLDVARALTFQSPSIRASNQLLVGDDGTLPDPGESGKLYFDFTNYLQPSSSALTATLSSSSPYLTITKGEVNLGAMAENSTIRNDTSPFEIILSPSLPIDQTVEALLTYSDGAYQDFQLISFVIPSYIDVNENNILTSITSAGRIGFGNTEEQNNGSGFIYNEESLLYEMGLIMGTSSATIFNNVRGINGAFDQDFTSASKIVKMTPGERSYSEITGDFRNSLDVGSASLSVSYRSLVWKNDPYKNFVILEYKVKNTTTDPIADFYFGIFADWDIASGGSGDRASWDNETRLGYVFPVQLSTLPQAGIQALSGSAQYYAIDNDQTIVGNPFGIYDGFTDTEKFSSVSSGLSKVLAGAAAGGNDVSHVVSSGPYTIGAGVEITIAFALHAANTNLALINSAKYADSLYNYTLKAPKPVVEPVEICNGNTAIVQATGAISFNWYRDFTGGSPFFTGSQFSTTNLFRDTVFYVSNADAHYESLRTTAHVSVKENPVINTLGSLEFCEGETVFLSVDVADEYTWSTGEKTQSIEVGIGGQYAVVVRNNTLECTSPEITVTVNQLPSASFIFSPENPSPNEAIAFSTEGESGVSWLWEFGDGVTSTEQNPGHTYADLGDFTVALTVTSAKGCQDMESKNIGIVTGMENLSNGEIEVYPNPVKTEKLLNVSAIGVNAVLSLYNAQGSLVVDVITTNADQNVLDIANLPNGVYMLNFITSQNCGTKKVIIAR